MFFSNAGVYSPCNAANLDEFINHHAFEKAQVLKATVEAERELKQKGLKSPDGPFDTMLRGLMNYTNHDDLIVRISYLYNRIDIDESGSVTLDEINHGMRKIAPHAPRIPKEEFEAITRGLCNDDGELTPKTFELLVLDQMRSFAQRKMVEAYGRASNTDEEHENVMFSLKTILHQTEDILAQVKHEEDSKLKKKSREEILQRLCRTAQKHCFHHWHDYIVETETERKLQEDRHLEVYNVPHRFFVKGQELTLHELLEAICGIYVEKMKFDVIDDTAGERRTPIPEFIREFLICKHGLKSVGLSNLHSLVKVVFSSHSFHASRCMAAASVSSFV